MKSRTTLSSLLMIIVIGSLIIGGCTQRVLDFTIVSSKQMHMRVKDSGKGNRVEGKDGVYWLITIPLGIPNLKEAVDRAIESAGPGYDALVDGVIYQQTYWYIITGYSGYKVVGTPVKTVDLQADFLRNGEKTDVAMDRILYHSSRGIANDTAIKNIGIVEVGDLDKPKETALAPSN